ncbi:hypothetical protein BDA99DRAFT_566056 [Phascolomyces articulosus]|uniref:Uncharacterized protein n=1 Tax=Phascolomyces articulosus TaxID=60185 RepID=A0AAD5P7D9_9FUNG|nr:hypothetical protein BDA99DRAFT_566056 [Phascolomyces articulosus]
MLSFAQFGQLEWVFCHERFLQASQAKNKQETVQTTLQPYKHRSIGQEQARNDPNNLTALQTPVHWSRTSKKRSKQPYSLTSTGPLVNFFLFKVFNNKKRAIVYSSKD